MFRHFGHGRKRSEIAAELNISVKTVDFYRMRIQQKLGLESSAMLRRIAVLARDKDRRPAPDPRPDPASVDEG